MAILHERSARGHTKTGWLDSYHTFSFGGFNDPSRMGHRSLRVINEDRVIPGAGFGEHNHSDMEIITLVLNGALRHQDSLGNGSIIKPDEIQRMSAGTGINHSEMNASTDQPVHFLQIWLFPDRDGHPPSYEQLPIPKVEGNDLIQLIASNDPSATGVTINQDARLYLGRAREKQVINHHFDTNRAGFIHVIAGRLAAGGEVLSSGDGLQLEAGEQCVLTAVTDVDFLLFDLA